jgi:hypothetical protein
MAEEGDLEGKPLLPSNGSKGGGSVENQHWWKVAQETYLISIEL